MKANGKAKGVANNYRFLILLFTGIVLGCIVGAIWPGATCFAPLGTLFMNIMLTLVVPLVFTSICGAVATMKEPARTGKIMGSAVSLFVIFGIIAAILTILVCRVIPLSDGAWASFEASTDTVAEVGIGDMLVNAFTVDDFASLLSRSNLLQLIVFSILLGFGINLSGGPECKVAKILIETSNAISKVVELVIKIAPISFFGLFASLIATYGPQLAGDYAKALIVYYPLCILYAAIMFTAWAYWGAGVPGVKMMFSKMIGPALTSLGTCSSAATIPTNMKAARESGVPDDVAEMVIPLGATMHMDGVVISTVIKAAFLFSVFGMKFNEVSIGKLALLVFIATFAAVGSAAVPRGGLIVESLICTLFFPQNMAIAFPLIMALGDLCDPGSTFVNSAGDYALTFVVARIANGKDWFRKAMALKKGNSITQ